MANRKTHNPERRVWAGRSYKAGGENIRNLKDRSASSADRKAENGPEMVKVEEVETVDPT